MSHAALQSFVGDLFSPALFESGGAVVLALVLLAGACAFGLLVVSPTTARPAVRALAGVPLLFIVGGAFAIVLYVLGAPVFSGLAFVIVASVFLIALAVRRGVAQALLAPRELLLLVFLLLLGFTFAFFGWGETADGTVRAMSGAWGDGPLHVLIAEAFVRRSPTSLLAKLRGAGGPDLSMPAFAGEQLREPFGYDFVAAMLRSVGFTVGGAFTLPAAGLLACLLAWVGHLAARLSLRGSENDRSNLKTPVPQRLLRFAHNDDGGAVAAVIAGILVITFGGLQWVIMAHRAAAWSPARFFGVHETFWAKAEELGLIWEHHLVIFSSQKHLLLAAAFILVLAGVLLASGREKRSVEGSNRRSALTDPVFVLAAGTSVLPLFHMHAFLAAGLLWISAALVTRSRRVFFGGVLAALLVLPLVIWLAGLFSRAGFLAFEPGWMVTGGSRGWLRFWLVNLGAFLPLSVLAVRRGIRRQRSDALLLVLPSLALFVLAHLVRFQPYRWDNFKLFLLAWLLVLPVVVAEMARWRFRGSRAVVWLLVLLMSLTTVSGLATHAQFRATSPVYDRADRAAARLLDVLLPPKAVVLADTDTRHNHPLTLTGRTLVAGYGGWLWTRNYAWEDRTRALAALRAAAPDGFPPAPGPLGTLAGARFCVLARAFGITHVVDRSATISPVRC